MGGQDANSPLAFVTDVLGPMLQACHQVAGRRGGERGPKLAYARACDFWCSLCGRLVRYLTLMQVLSSLFGGLHQSL